MMDAESCKSRRAGDPDLSGKDETGIEDETGVEDESDVQSEQVENEEAPPDPNAPEFGISLMGALTTIRHLQGEIATVKAVLGRLGPIVEEMRTAWEKAGPSIAELIAVAKEFRSNL